MAILLRPLLLRVRFLPKAQNCSATQTTRTPQDFAGTSEEVSQPTKKLLDAFDTSCQHIKSDYGDLRRIANGNCLSPSSFEGSMASLTLCLINQKGGCGKSSTCFHLAGAFAAAGCSVLLVDADPQGSLSQGFLGSDCVENLPADQTLAAVFDESSFFLDQRSLIRPTAFDSISIIPANQHLAAFNKPCPESSGMIQYALRDLPEQFGEFDVRLIDCPPNLYQNSWNAMIAASHVLIPVPPEDFGTQGLRAVHQCIENARCLNPELRRLGHILTRYDGRLLVHRSYSERLRDLYREMVLDTVMPEASAFKVSLACRKPVQFYAAKTRAAESMRSLASEIFSRVEARSKRRNTANRNTA